MFEQELGSCWKKVVDTIKDGVMIVDKGGTIFYTNRAMEEITVYSNPPLDQSLFGMGS